MGRVCTPDQFPEPNGEHPVVAVIAVIAIVAAILLIVWARLEVHGIDDIEAAPKTAEERKVDAAVTSSRFATGFSP